MRHGVLMSDEDKVCYYFSFFEKHQKLRENQLFWSMKIILARIATVRKESLKSDVHFFFQLVSCSIVMKEICSFTEEDGSVEVSDLDRGMLFSSVGLKFFEYTFKDHDLSDIIEVILILICNIGDLLMNDATEEELSEPYSILQSYIFKLLD